MNMWINQTWQHGSTLDVKDLSSPSLFGRIGQLSNTTVLDNQVGPYYPRLGQNNPSVLHNQIRAHFFLS
jgi:hypothetical protein